MNSKTTNTVPTANMSPMSIEALAALGGGKLAYLKPIKSDDIGIIFPGAPQIASGLNLFALLAADGSPILITDSRDAALANAMEQDLETVSIH
ncbi:MAG: DUF1150 family protein [Hyphomicrobiales bacterium]